MIAVANGLGFLLMARYAIVIAFAFCVGPKLAVGQQQEMQFTGVPPLQPIAIFGNAWLINARGPITPGTAPRFADFIKRNNIPARSSVFLSSPGGSVIEAIEIGKLIRQMGFTTHIGYKSDWGEKKYVDGTCFSACVLAFIGGKFRYSDSDTQLGVHLFSFSDSRYDNSQNGQILSNIILQYIQSMGINSALFSDMTSYAPESIGLLRRSRMIELNVINSGVEKTRWTIESTSAGMYMKGERDTVWGIQKISFLCGEKKNIGVVVMFDDQGRESEIKKMAAVTFVIDGTEHKLTSETKTVGKIVQGGVASIIFSLPNTLAKAISEAQSLSLYVQYDFGAPFFFGISAMEMRSARDQFVGFTKSCRW